MSYYAAPRPEPLPLMTPGIAPAIGVTPSVYSSAYWGDLELRRPLSGQPLGRVPGTVRVTDDRYFGGHQYRTLDDTPFGNPETGLTVFPDLTLTTPKKKDPYRLL